MTHGSARLISLRQFLNRTVPDRAAVSDSTSSIRITTNVFKSSRYSFILENIFITNLPDSEKYFENNEWALISNSSALLYGFGVTRIANL